MKIAREPMPGSYAGRLIAYFRHNPDELLTTADLKTKLGPVANLATSLRSAVDSGYIDKRVVGQGLGATYSAGPRLLREIRYTPHQLELDFGD